MTRAKGCSLWLMPAGETYRKLEKLILELSRRYSAPRFSPHVTLLGQVLDPPEVAAAKTEELASILHPFTVRLTRVDCLDEYFRCLFIRVEESRAVMGANEAARRVFNGGGDPEYMPHLSLLYGDFPSDTKRRIISGIGENFDIAFEAGEIHLFSTAGPPEDWYRMGVYPLKRSP